jgi:hypothetical protein
MKSSAKVTAVSFVAATALGAAIFMGCTFGSGTVDDTDGGTQNPDSGRNETSTPTDGGPPGDSSACSTPTRTFTIGSEACQACANTKCCGQQQACFGIAGDPDAGTTDCNDYNDCYVAATTPDDIAVCDLAASQGVPAAYQQMLQCLESNCAADCPQ